MYQVLKTQHFASHLGMDSGAINLAKFINDNKIPRENIVKIIADKRSLLIILLYY